MKTMDKTGKIIDTKIVWNRKGWLYQITRTRKGMIDTISVSYPMPTGIKTISRKIFAGFGWIAQKGIELGLDWI